MSVSADLIVKHRRAVFCDWYSQSIVLFLFLVCTLFEMFLIDDDHEGLCFGIIVGNKLL